MHRMEVGLHLDEADCLFFPHDGAITMTQHFPSGSLDAAHRCALHSIRSIRAIMFSVAAYDQRTTSLAALVMTGMLASTGMPPPRPLCVLRQLCSR